MRAKQILYFFTRIIAKVIYAFDRKRTNQLRERWEILRLLNKKSYIDTVSEVIYQQNLVLQPYPNEEMLRLGSIIEAERMFKQKKKHGDFDNLNILITE